MSQRRYRVNERRWLNPDSNAWLGYILTQVEDTSRGRVPNRYPHTLFKMADCHRTIELDFSMWRDKDRLKSIEKARLIRDALIEFTAALEAENDVIMRRRAHLKKK